MLPWLAFFGLRSLLVSANQDVDDDVVVEDEGMSNSGFPGGKMPSPEDLLKMLDNMGGLSDEDREALRQDLLKQVGGAGGAGGGLNEDNTAMFATSFFTSQLFVLLTMLTFISLIFGNFEFG